MIQRRKKTAYTVFLTVVILITLVFSAVTYGWLVNYIHGDFGFQAKQLDNLKLEIARITVEKPAPEVYDETNRTTYNECANGKIEAKEDGTHLDVALGNMSFGAIDNVAQLKPENTVYLRLTVPKSVGNTVKVNLHYSDNDFIVLYKNGVDDAGNPTTTPEQVVDTAEKPIISNLLALERPDGTDPNSPGSIVEADLGSERNSYLLFGAVASNTNCTPDKIAETFESTSAAGSEQTVAETTADGSKFSDSNYKKFVTNEVYDANSATYTITVTNPDVTDDPNTTEDDNYYVYIKVVPNLAVFAHCIEYITDIMPCYMYFKISATFEAGPFSAQPAA